jgi:hypothetical protein
MEFIPLLPYLIRLSEFVSAPDCGGDVEVGGEARSLRKPTSKYENLDQA